MNRYSWTGSKGSGKSPATKRISTPAGQRLSVIMESGNHQPSANVDSRGHRLTNMSFAQRLHLGRPPQAHEEEKPPSYFEGDIWEEETREPSRFLPESWRRDIRRRGGWGKFALILLVVLAVIIALAVGLGVGLTQKHDSDGDATPSDLAAAPSTVQVGVTGATPAPGAPPSFPQGSYSVSLLLSSQATNCTSNADTWTCYPGVVYEGSSAQSSEATFNWIINQVDNSQLQISGSDNPFVPQFSNLPLTLVDSGSDTERYTFQVPTVKATTPTTPLTDDNVKTQCFFNQTTLQGALYTRKQKATPVDATGTSTGVAPGSTWTAYPFAASFEQVSGGGENVPNCYRTDNGAITGDPISGIAAEPQGNLCSCFYMNYM